MQKHFLRYFISLNFLKLTTPNSPKSKAMIMHHGMLGSGRNFKPLCTNSTLLNYVDILLLDARNHGKSINSI
jgi:pimeloyl-ACP methyl ester carboxylesterase